jgi:hypothetical protein
LLDDLSKRLPDDTWAQSIEIRSVPNQKAKEVVIQGETGSGGKILQLVQESPMIKDPAFKATMTRVAANAERFHIAGEMVAAELPKSLVLTDSAAIITVPVSPAPVAGAPVTAKAPGAATLSPPPPPATAPTATPPTLSPSPVPAATDAAKKPPLTLPSPANGAPALSAPPAALERRS